MDNKDATLMEIPVNDQIIKNYQALYYAMNAKPDCKSKIFFKNSNYSFIRFKGIKQ